MKPKFIKFLLKDRVINLDYNELCDLINILSDSEKNMDIFHYFSKTDFSTIRSKVASMENLHDKTIEVLLEDENPLVMKSIIRNDSFLKLMTKADLENIIATNNTEIMITILENLNKLTDIYKVCNKKWLYEVLVDQQNPDVRLELIMNDRTPKYVLEKIAEDEFRNIESKEKQGSEAFKNKSNQFNRLYSNLSSSIQSKFFRSSSIAKVNKYGRVKLPERFLEIIINESNCKLILTRRDGCIHAYTLGRWKNIESDFTRKLGYSKGTRLFRTFYISSACVCKIINSNQIEIPQYLIKYANLHKNIYFVGDLNRFEIWDEEKWGKENRILEDELFYEEREDIEDLLS